MNANLCKQPNGSQCEDARQVLVVGGGMRATLSGGLFENNTARMGVTVLGGSKLTVRGTLFVRNRMCKGALYGFPGSDLQIRDAVFEENLAGSHGGAVFMDNCTASFSSCRFAVNVAWESGGAFHAKNSTLTVGGSSFSNNTAPTGGALAVYSSHGVTSLVVIKDLSVFKDNNASQSLQSLVTASVENYYKLGVAGAIYSEWANVSISDTQLEGNKAVMNGGAIFVQSGHVNLSSCKVVGNHAHRDGGALFVDADKGTAWLYVTNTTLRNNTAEGNGGGLYVRKRAHVSITESRLEANKAWSLGGALCTDMDARSDNNIPDNGSNLEAQEIGNITVDAKFRHNTGLGFNLFVGPDFNLAAAAGKRFDLTKKGVRWWRRRCEKGEYVANSSYCPPNMYLLTPGTQFMQCIGAEKTAHAPGGAVLVPLSSHWHGSGDTVQALSCGPHVYCPDINMSLGKVVRCPNPDACHHDVEQLADKHPNRSPHQTWRLSMLKWEEYGQQLCAQGYMGMLCGACKGGYGQTAPFKCVACLNPTGRQVPQKCGASPSYAQQLVPVPDRKALSGLWTAYWLVLTLSTMFGVWSAMHVNHTTALQHKGGSNRATGTGNSRQSCSMWGGCKGADVSQCSPGSNPAAIGGRVLEQSLGVWKVLSNYIVRVNVVVSLPISFLPWAQRANSHAPSQAVQWLLSHASWVSNVYRLVLGGPASADCLLQSWGLWTGCDVQAAATSVMMRVLISAVVVPSVLWLSAVLLPMVWRSVFPVAQRYLPKAAACCQQTWAPCCSDAQRGCQCIRHECAFSCLYWCPWLVRAGRKSGHPKPRHTGMAPEPHEMSKAVQGKPDVGSSSSLASQAPKPLVGGSNDSSASNKSGTFGGQVTAYAIAAGLVVFFANYQTVVQAAMGLLSCVKVDHSWWWVMDVRLGCPMRQPQVPWAQGAVATGVVLLVWCLVVPLALGLFLGKQAWVGNIESTGEYKNRFVAALAYRYADYNLDDDFEEDDVNLVRLAKRLRISIRVAWDSVIDLLLRLPLSAVVLLVTLHELHQLLLVVAVLGVYLLLMVSVRPWKSPWVLLLQVAAVNVLMVACFIIMACSISHMVAAPPADLGWTVKLAGVAGGLIAGYFAFLVVALVYCFFKEVRQVWNIAKSIWGKLCACLAACCVCCVGGSAGNAGQS